MTSRTLVGARQSALLGLRLDKLRPLPEPVELTSGLRKDARRGAARAAILVEAQGGQVEPGTCGAVERWYDRTPCRRPAGRGTGHEGDGPCSIHERAAERSPVRAAEVAWVMAHKFAQELDVSPWEGLLKAVRIAAGKVAYTEWVLSQAKDDIELEGRFGRDRDGILLHPDTGEPLGVGQVRNLRWWVNKNELWTERLARWSKMAIDAGVAERLVEIERTHAEQIAHVLNGVLTSLESQGMDDDTLAALRRTMREQLLALDAAPVRVEAQVVDGR